MPLDSHICLYWALICFFVITPSAAALMTSISKNISKALEHHSLGRFDEALSGYINIISQLKTQDNIDVKVIAKLHGNAGAIYMQYGQYKEAKSHFTSAVEAAPDDSAMRMNLAILLTTKLNDHRKALKHVMKVVQTSPSNAKGYHLLGNILQNMGRDEEAEKYFIMAEQVAQETNKETIHVEQDISVLLQRLGEMRRDENSTVEIDGREYVMTCLSERPLIVRVPQLLNAEECLHIISKSGDKLERSFSMGGGKVARSEVEALTSQVAVDGDQRVEYEADKSSEPSKAFRVSDNTWLSTDEVLSPLQHRISALTGMPPSYVTQKSEELQVVRYSSLGYFRVHQDSSAFHRRRLTALIYLNDVPSAAGGETWFPFANLNAGEADDVASMSVQDAIDRSSLLDPHKSGHGLLVQPRRGDGIIFVNHNIGDGAIDPAAVHAGLAVAEGAEKWIANYWIG